jgi:hypothetical protein
MEKELRFEEVPDWWAVCIYETCPMKEQCLRYRAAMAAPPSLKVHKCVITRPVVGCDRCECYEPVRTVRFAKGFGNIFMGVRTDAYRRLKPALMKYLGSTSTSKGTFYRYLHGERLLTPAQQDWIRQWLTRNGITIKGDFAEYVDDFCFRVSKKC